MFTVKDSCWSCLQGSVREDLSSGGGSDCRSGHAMRAQIRPISKGEDTMSHAVKKRRALAFLRHAAVALPAGWLMFQVSAGNVILKAAGINPNEENWGAITKVANQL